MEKVRAGVVGCGMGRNHARALSECEKADLVGVCDMDRARADRTAADLKCRAFHDADEFIRKDVLDAVVVAVPHYAHPELTVKAFERGIHVLCEKPVAVHVNHAQAMIDAQKGTGLRFAAMFQMRVNPVWRKVKALFEAGHIGPLTRVCWINTDWFRSQGYYDSGKWRGTWSGEGGGLLVNQLPHNLDMFQWICGMPARVRGFCHFGKTHKVEVEDEFTAYFEFPNGATGLMFSSTGEPTRIDRFEVIGDAGLISVCKGRIERFQKMRMPASEAVKEPTKSFACPETWDIGVPIAEDDIRWKGIIGNFIDAILDKNVKLIAPGEEGVNSVMLANAILYSSLEERTVDLPLDGDAFEARLNELIAKSQ